MPESLTLFSQSLGNESIFLSPSSSLTTSVRTSATSIDTTVDRLEIYLPIQSAATVDDVSASDRALLSPISRITLGRFFPGFDYELAGGTANSTIANPTAGIMMAGGAEADTLAEPGATEWFLNLADGGDYLVLRYGGTGEQADWIWENYSDRVSSAAELSVNNRFAANNPRIAQLIRDAEALFIAGGDQNDYEDTWKGTLVEDAINYLINEKKAPVGGTSAGMAILGESYYAPAGRDLLSSEILNNPFHPNTRDINHGDFLNVPILNNTITETHLDRAHGADDENRYGRLFGFLARVVDDNGNQLPSYGIGLEEGAFIGIDANGVARAFGNGTIPGSDAYFVQTNGVVPETIEAGVPLVWNNNAEAAKVYRIAGTTSGSGSFDLTDWITASGGNWESWYSTGGYGGFTRDFNPAIAPSSDLA